jgi:hypothetical protein
MGTLRLRRIILGPVLAVGAVAIAACAQQPKGPAYDEVINSYIGNTEANLVSTWGIPDRSHKLATGGEVLEYTRRADGDVVCTTRFTIDRTGRVVKTWYNGTGCG